MLPPPAATITVETTATRFKVSVRHTWGFSTPAGVAIFRATGIACRNLMLRGPTSIYYELHLPRPLRYRASLPLLHRTHCIISLPRRRLKLQGHRPRLVNEELVQAMRKVGGCSVLVRFLP